MIEQTLKDAVSNNWPMLLIFTVVIVTIRITYLVVHKDKFVLYKELFMLAFLIYAMLLFYVVTFIWSFCFIYNENKKGNANIIYIISYIRCNRIYTIKNWKNI